jgi:hypothetical protein
VELSLIQAQSELTTGRSLFTFGLSTPSGDLIVEGSPQVYVARTEGERALGPFPAAWHAFTGYERTGDTSPKSPLPGFYAAELELPSPGTWMVAATARTDQGPGTGEGAMTVVPADEVPAAVGSPALPQDTPVATKPARIRDICTREPPDPMHYISLRDALTNGKPTVLDLGTPLFCESRMCGPVLDEQLLVFRALGKDRANFIHLEIFPTRQLDRPARQFLAWGFDSEPWTLIIDRGGIIRARFEGPVSAELIRQALQPLL